MFKFKFTCFTGTKFSNEIVKLETSKLGELCEMRGGEFERVTNRDFHLIVLTCEFYVICWILDDF